MAGLFGDLKADRTPVFLLAHRCALHRIMGRDAGWGVGDEMTALWCTFAD
jgi:hypothetical protein